MKNFLEAVENLVDEFKAINYEEEFLEIRLPFRVFYQLEQYFQEFPGYKMPARKPHEVTTQITTTSSGGTIIFKVKGVENEPRSNK